MEKQTYEERFFPARTSRKQNKKKRPDERSFIQITVRPGTHNKTYRYSLHDVTRSFITPSTALFMSLISRY